MNTLSALIIGEASCRIYPQDLDRIARRIERSRRAYNLTELGYRLVRGRLRYGPIRSEPLAVVPSPAERVRIWDPEGAWHKGDHALFAIPVFRERIRAFVPRVGEVIRVQDRGAVVRVDYEAGVRIVGTAAAGEDETVEDWRRTIRDTVAVLRDREDELSRIECVLWQQGETILSALLSALHHDPRFVEIGDRWFLRSAAERPAPAQLEALARALLRSQGGPRPVSELVPLLPHRVAEGDAGLFGLMLALQEHPNLFTRVGDSSDPPWRLSGPPPGVYVARWAAFDPETYELLCEPAEMLEPETVQRLWDLGMLGDIGVVSDAIAGGDASPVV